MFFLVELSNINSPFLVILECRAGQIVLLWEGCCAFGGIDGFFHRPLAIGDLSDGSSDLLLLSLVVSWEKVRSYWLRWLEVTHALIHPIHGTSFVDVKVVVVV